MKDLGEVASFGPEDGELMVSFAIDAITVAPECTSTYANPAENGHLVRVDLRIETTPELEHDQYWMMSAHDFTVVGPDGVTETNLGTSAAYSCLDRSEQLSLDALSPASKYRGSVVIDTRSVEGVLTLQPAFVGDSGGWEWRFGS